MQSPPPLTTEKSTLGIVALIFGICGFIPFLGILLGLVGLIMGIIALATRKAGRGFAVAGLVLGLIAMLLHVVLVVPVLLYAQKRPMEIRPIVLERRAPSLATSRPAPLATNVVIAPAANKTEGNVAPQPEPPTVPKVKSFRMSTASSRSETVLSAQEAAVLLADVQSGEQRRLIPATMKLMRTRPEQPEPAMARALTVVLLESSSLPLRVNAARALENWGTAESLPALEKAAADPNPLLQTHAKKAGTKISGTAP
jgi:hypothetical protein